MTPVYTGHRWSVWEAHKPLCLLPLLNGEGTLVLGTNVLPSSFFFVGGGPAPRMEESQSSAQHTVLTQAHCLPQDNEPHGAVMQANTAVHYSKSAPEHSHAALVATYIASRGVMAD